MSKHAHLALDHPRSGELYRRLIEKGLRPAAARNEAAKIMRSMPDVYATSRSKKRKER